MTYRVGKLDNLPANCIVSFTISISLSTRSNKELSPLIRLDIMAEVPSNGGRSKDIVMQTIVLPGL